MAVALASLVACTPGPIDLMVVDVGLDREDRQLLGRAARPWPLIFATLPPAWMDGLPASPMPTSSYGRLYLSRLAPETTRRILYLDGDILVRRSVLPLLALDLAGNTVAAVGNTPGSHFGHRSVAGGIPGWREEGIPPAAMVFNSGVLVIDRAAWEARDTTDRVLRTARELRGPSLWPDQASLNLALWREWLPMDRRWNTHHTDAAIAHFFGPKKPWGPPPVPNRLYVEYQDRAAALGWDIPGRRRLRARFQARELARAVVPPRLLRHRASRVVLGPGYESIP
jgi:lipopolysaccharide biosynthesis glycosyltransferase